MWGVNHFQTTNLSANQLNNQLTNQTTNQRYNQPASPSSDGRTDRRTDGRADQPANQLISQPTNQPTNQPTGVWLKDVWKVNCLNVWGAVFWLVGLKSVFLSVGAGEARAAPSDCARRPFFYIIGTGQEEPAA